ncbi:hypothetical protein LSTR_LSTR005833 [Laodelphax striatellus]|uniref:Uncharacterized protein n=1 Tax=Laodelphax striatellus TaxID=195883 RepID=A0A482WR13_LAOST|nr:hypothetical protein LSTR_LSTR005833 [Laodelphax striatellus]
MSNISDTECEDSVLSLDQKSLNDAIDVNEVKKLIDVDYALDMHYQLAHADDDVRKKIKNLEIFVDWEVPVSHNSLQYIHSSKVDQDLSAVGQGLKLTNFTIEEDQILKANWDSFKQEYGFNDPKYFLRGYLTRTEFNDTTKKKFVQLLGRGLPQRTLRSIYDRFYEIYAEESTGRFTYVEDQIILAIKCSNSEYFKEHTKTKVLLELLGRKKITLLRRYQKLGKDAVVGGFSAPFNWTIDICKDLVTLMKEETGVKDISLLEETRFEAGHWEKLGEKLGINSTHLLFFWETQLSPLLFAKQCISRNKLRCFLVIWFLAHGEVEDWDEICWLDVALDLSVPRMICFRVLKSMVTSYVPENLWLNVQDCVRYLYSNYFDLFSSNKLKDRYLNSKFFKENLL